MPSDRATHWSTSAFGPAANKLRTTLRRLGRLCGRLVSADPERLVLSPDVRVDATERAGLSRRPVHDPDPHDLRGLPALVAALATEPSGLMRHLLEPVTPRCGTS